jgi:hypothetical protein
MSIKMTGLFKKLACEKFTGKKLIEGIYDFKRDLYIFLPYLPKYFLKFNSLSFYEKRKY